MPVAETPLVFDYDISGRVGVAGDILQVWEKEALVNSLKMWIMSRKGDIIREPNRGGYLIQWLTRPMSEENAENVEMAIRDGIDQDFDPYLKILFLKVTPNYINRYWDIYMEVESPQLNVQTALSARIKGTT
jgi:hypothetical protein